MMCSPEEYEKSIKTYDFNQLEDERKKLIRAYKACNRTQYNIDPSPDVVCKVEKEYLDIVKRHLLDRYPKAYIAALNEKERRSEIVNLIDRTLKKIWLKNIVNDFLNSYLLREDSLKCAFYYHLRRKLSFLMDNYNIRIYPEFYIKALQYRADIAIVQIDPDKEVRDLRDAAVDYLAILEIKFVSGKNKQTLDVVKKDFSKILDYYTSLPNAQYYWVVLYEEEYTADKFIDKRATNNWANGNVSLLYANRSEGYEYFEVKPFNNLNPDLKK